MITENNEIKEDNLFDLSLDLFHLRLKRKNFLAKSNDFKPHLISLLKKKIALLKRKQNKYKK